MIVDEPPSANALEQIAEAHAFVENGLKKVMWQ
jgi:hypothetical protein